MNKFSETSRKRLETCHPDLQKLFNEVIKHYDCSVICGYRGKDEQEEAFRTGKSKVKFPNSKHNAIPSMAVDVVPYPVNWKNELGFYHFIGFVRGMAAQLGIKIRSGGDWDGDYDLKDQNFFDLPHFELIGESNASIE